MRPRRGDGSAHTDDLCFFKASLGHDPIQNRNAAGCSQKKRALLHGLVGKNPPQDQEGRQEGTQFIDHADGVVNLETAQRLCI